MVMSRDFSFDARHQCCTCCIFIAFFSPSQWSVVTSLIMQDCHLFTFTHFSFFFQCMFCCLILQCYWFDITLAIHVCLDVHSELLVDAFQLGLPCRPDTHLGFFNLSQTSSLVQQCQLVLVNILVLLRQFIFISFLSWFINLLEFWTHICKRCYEDRIVMIFCAFC